MGEVPRGVKLRGILYPQLTNISRGRGAGGAGNVLSKMYYYQFILVQAGGMRGGKTFSGRTILLGVAVWMDKLAQHGAKLKL
jgi:hypothetical protein